MLIRIHGAIAHFPGPGPGHDRARDTDGRGCAAAPVRSIYAQTGGSEGPGAADQRQAKIRGKLEWQRVYVRYGPSSVLSPGRRR